MNIQAETSPRACENCRKRKTKCDRTLPSCGSCVKFHRTCFYESVKLRTCMHCAKLKVKCSRELPKCQKCRTKGIDCIYPSQNRGGRTAVITDVQAKREKPSPADQHVMKAKTLDPYSLAQEEEAKKRSVGVSRRHSQIAAPTAGIATSPGKLQRQSFAEGFKNQTADQSEVLRKLSTSWNGQLNLNTINDLVKANGAGKSSGVMTPPVSGYVTPASSVDSSHGNSPMHPGNTSRYFTQPISNPFPPLPYYPMFDPYPHQQFHLAANSLPPKGTPPHPSLQAQPGFAPGFHRPSPIAYMPGYAGANSTVSPALPAANPWSFHQSYYQYNPTYNGFNPAPSFKDNKSSHLPRHNSTGQVHLPPPYYGCNYNFAPVHERTPKQPSSKSQMLINHSQLTRCLSQHAAKAVLDSDQKGYTAHFSDDEESTESSEEDEGSETLANTELYIGPKLQQPLIVLPPGKSTTPTPPEEISPQHSQGGKIPLVEDGLNRQSSLDHTPQEKNGTDTAKGNAPTLPLTKEDGSRIANSEECMQEDRS